MRALSHTPQTLGAAALVAPRRAGLAPRPAAPALAGRRRVPRPAATLAPAPAPVGRDAAAAAPGADAEDRIIKVHAPGEFDALLAANADKLVVLKCKSTHCKPCRIFRPKYAAAARHYADAVFTEVMGDESTELRNWMKAMQIRATPTFKMYRGGQEVSTHTGISEEKMHQHLQAHTRPGEAGHGVVELLGNGSDSE